MADKPSRNLEEMNEEEARQFLIELLTNLSPEDEYELRHEAYVMEIPQSGERILGRNNMRDFQAAYPDPPTIELRRLIVRESLWVAELISDYSGRRFHAVLIIELQDGKIVRDTRYYAEPFDPPAWRAGWVERMDC